MGEAGRRHVNVHKYFSSPALNLASVASRSRVDIAAHKLTLDTVFALERIDNVLTVLDTGREDQTGVTISHLLHDFIARQTH